MGEKVNHHHSILDKDCRLFYVQPQLITNVGVESTSIIFVRLNVYTLHPKLHIYAYIYVYLYIYLICCVLFITGYYTDDQVYQIIDTVQCKLVYLSSKEGVLTRRWVPLSGTVF